MATRRRTARSRGRATIKEPITPSTGNVFADLGYEPQEAEHLRIRSILMAAVRERIRRQGLTQAAAADVFGVTQPRISDLVRGKIELFSIDTLVAMLARAGVKIEVRTKPFNGRRSGAA